MTNLVDKNFAGSTPAVDLSKATPESQAVLATAGATAAKVEASVRAMEPQIAIDHVVLLLNEANKYVGDRAPWKQVKDDLPAAAETLYVGLEVLRIAGTLLTPVMPEKMRALLETIGVHSPDSASAKKTGLLAAGTPVKKAEPLFPRVVPNPVNS